MRLIKKFIVEIKKLMIYSVLIIIFLIFMAKNYNDNGGIIFNNIKNYGLNLNKDKNSDNSSSYYLAKELKRVGNLICYEGKYTYTYFDEENKWYGYKNISANLIYNFGLGIDFSTINIKVDNNIVIVDIPMDKIKITYIELENKDSTLKYFNSFFMEKYDINEIQRKCKESVKNEISNEKGYFEEAVLSIKDRIKTISKDFGYNRIEFK